MMSSSPEAAQTGFLPVSGTTTSMPVPAMTWSSRTMTTMKFSVGYDGPDAPQIDQLQEVALTGLPWGQWNQWEFDLP